MTTETKDYARDNAASWMDTILGYQAAVQCDFDQLESLQYDKAHLDEGEEAAWNEENGEELAALLNAAGEFESQEQAEEQARESILDLQVRGDWHAPGDTEGDSPTEFMILLSTGGPALRIMGELNQYNEPSRAWLEYQDWGTPWTDYFGDNNDADALLWFSSLFYFGE